MQIKLNASQQHAVDCNDKKILCLACAGAGKTQVLVSRLNRLINKDNVNPQSILCLTFTRAAALEMRERYSKLQKSLGIGSQIKPEISTFHAFCYSLINHDINVRKKLGYFKVPKVLDPNLEDNYVEEAIVQGNIKLPKKKLKKSAMRSRPEEQIYKLYEKIYLRLLKRDNLITFDILCSGVCKLFYFDDPSIISYKQQYKHILVDEFQDTDYKQVQFIESFKDASLFCVGDALQNLYSFRGTSNKYVKEYSKDDSWTKIRMDRNYRSTIQICEYANANSTYAESEYRIELNSIREGIPVTVENIITNDEVYDLVPSNELERIVENIEEGKETAILCRTNKQVERVQRYLLSQKIDCTTSKKDYISQNLLKSSIDSEYLIDWLSTLLPSDKYANYIRLKTLEENPDVRWFIANFGQTFNIKDLLIKISDLRNIIIKEYSKKTPNSIIISILMEYLQIPELYSFDCSNMNLKESILALIDKINESSISEVYVGTVHSVKGLEFEDVVVVGVNGKSFRLNNEDNLNVFYVAITRAKDKLTVLEER